MKMKDLKRQSHKILPKYPFLPKNNDKERKNSERGNFQRKLKDTKRLLISILAPKEQKKLEDTKRLLISILTPKRTKEVKGYKTTVF